MRESVLDLFPSFYDERQTASAAVHIAHIDMLPIEDGTYFVHEADGEINACGGWSRRAKLFTGEGAGEDDERLIDPGRSRRGCGRCSCGATGRGAAWAARSSSRASAPRVRRASARSPLPLARPRRDAAGRAASYRAFGFREVECFRLTMPDGVSVECVHMERPVSRE